MVFNTITCNLLRFIRLVLDFIARVIGIRYPTKQRYLPPIDDRILLHSATEIAEKIKSGNLKSEDVVRAYIARIELIQPHVNAVIQDRFAHALNEAREIDRRVEQELSGHGPNDGESILSKPFLGVPFSSKDSVAIKGMYLMAGLYARKGITADENCDVVNNLINAGAIPMCLTNVPELVMWWDSYNTVFGRAYNPYDRSRITGGSSGGEAALIASAGSVFGIGADIGGSIRMPCFFCGIFGHKTTPLIVSSKGHFPQGTLKQKRLLSVGPMCRYARDLKPMLKVMAGDENAKMLELDTGVDVRKLRVHYMEKIDHPFNTPVDSDMRNLMKRVVKYFETKGNSVKRVDLKLSKYAFPIWLNAMHDDSAPLFSAQMANLKGNLNPFTEILKCFIGISKHTICAVFTCFSEYLPLKTSKKLEKMREDLTNDLHKLLGDDGILIFPTHPEPAPKHNGTLLKVFNVSYTQLFNPLFVAITQVPLGLSEEGLPIGLQIVAAPYKDRISIAVAEELEKEFGGWTLPCDVKC